MQFPMAFFRHLTPLMRTVLRMGLLAVILVACDVGEPELPGLIEGRVSGEGVGLSGVTVELTGAVNRLSETDNAGIFRFSDVPPGAYVVSIRNFPLDAVFPAVARTATVVSSGTQQVDFLGSFVRTGVISGVVRSPGRGIGGVKVTLTGPDTGVQVTRSDGTFRFTALRSGPYTVEISDFSPTLQFPGTKSEVVLQPGQIHEMEFFGRADLTATIAIERFDQVLPDGSRIPVDLRRVFGILEVVALVQPRDDSLESVGLFLGGVEVATQRFGVGAAPPDAPASAGPSSSQRLVFSVATNAFDSKTGIPRWLNGDHILSVQITTAEGGAGAATAQAQIGLDNADTFTGRILPAGQEGLGLDGNLWFGGGLAVEVLPVLFNRQKSLSSLVLELRGDLNQERVSRVQWSGTGPIRLSFPLLGSDGLGGYFTRVPEGDRIVVVDARDGAGQRFAGLPLTLLSGLRLDFAPPTVQGFGLPLPREEELCCLGQWVGASFRFSSALSGVQDPGVGSYTVRIHAGPADATNTAILATPPIQEGRDLTASSGIDTYRAVAVLEDGLGNRREVPLQTSGLGGTTFGVDLAPPTLTLVGGEDGPRARWINPVSESLWAFSAQDGESGLAPLPLLSTLRRWGPGDPEAGVCLSPSQTGVEASCSEILSGLVRPVPEPAQGPGYFRVQARAVDRGGNRSDPIDAWALLDQTPPEISSLFLVSQTGAGGTVVLGMDLKDNLDLHEVRGYLNFPAVNGWGSPATLRLAAPVQPVAVGVPFVLPLTPQASVEASFPFIAALQQAASGADSTSAGGLLRFASAVEIAALDAARNAGRRQLSLPSVNLTSVRGFDAQTRGPEAAVLAWELSVTSIEAAPDGRARFRIQAVAGGDPSTFQSPFDAVHIVSLGEGENARWLGSMTQSPASGSPSGTPLLRRIEWVLEWTAPKGWAGETLQVTALGLDRAGAGLLSRTVPLAIPAP